MLPRNISGHLHYGLQRLLQRNLSAAPNQRLEPFDGRGFGEATIDRKRADAMHDREDARFFEMDLARGDADRSR